MPTAKSIWVVRPFIEHNSQRVPFVRLHSRIHETVRYRQESEHALYAVTCKHSDDGMQDHCAFDSRSFRCCWIDWLHLVQKSWSLYVTAEADARRFSCRLHRLGFGGSLLPVTRQLLVSWAGLRGLKVKYENPSRVHSHRHRCRFLLSSSDGPPTRFGWGPRPRPDQACKPDRHS